MVVSGSPRTLPHKTPRAAGMAQIPDRIYHPLGTEIFADEFDDASIQADWVRVDPTGNSGHIVWTEANGLMTALHNGTTETGPAGHYLMRPLPSGVSPPVVIETRQRGMVPLNYSYNMTGLAFTDGTTWGAGSQVVYMPYMHGTSNGGAAQSIRLFTSFTTQSLSYNDAIELSQWAPYYARIIWVAANSWRYEISVDGIAWKACPNQSFTLTPTHMGLYISNWSNAITISSAWDYFRVYDEYPPAGEVQATL